MMNSQHLELNRMISAGHIKRNKMIDLISGGIQDYKKGVNNESDYGVRRYFEWRIKQLNNIYCEYINKTS